MTLLLHFEDSTLYVDFFDFLSQNNLTWVVEESTHIVSSFKAQDVNINKELYSIEDRFQGVVKIKDIVLRQESNVLIGVEGSKNEIEQLLRKYKEYRSGHFKGKQIVLERGAISRNIPVAASSLSWEDLILNSNLKNIIQSNVESFVKGSEFYKNRKIPYRRGILMWGPPGCGKTLSCRIIASMYKIPFISAMLNAESTEKDLDAIFEEAEEVGPSVLCFEDMDTLLDKTKISKSYLLNKIDGLTAMNGILLIGTTNHPKKIDTALTNRPGRFDRVLYIGTPRRKERRAMIEYYFGDFPEMVDFILNKSSIIRRTEGFSGAYMREIYVSACHCMLLEGKTEMEDIHISRAMIEISMQIDAFNSKFNENKIKEKEKESDENDEKTENV